MCMMEHHDDQMITREESEQNWKIITHPLYQPKTSPWLDLRVFYLRFSSFEVDESTPKHLTLRHIPLSPDTIIEVNGKRSSIYSECVFSLLRRDRVDKETGEATFVGTDSIRMTGSVRFEVYNKDDLLFSGALELCNSNGFTGESKKHCKKWNISCQQEMSAGTSFLKGKQHMGPEAWVPTIDVYVTGCFSRNPIILTKTLQLGPRKKHHPKAMLDSIPENESAEMKKDEVKVFQMANEVTDDLGFYYSENNMDEDADSFYSRLKYLEEDGGELSWFNAGVRVGVGIGLGVCLGVGVGVGLLLRSYQTATRSFRRRLL
ncbi:hypothetical protein Taro_019345 [Colocasia esculenta]|uniref:Erythronate-4-phosphate dehydrogenase family protein n=1 Tax=Colocasia esculenta TaxID=4460 RepID=A0A843UKV5_COLES|nr:hypothetical protein [Colocasia esculenta]